MKLSDTIFDGGPIYIELGDRMLELPPQPNLLFKDRPRNKYGARVSLDVFLQEIWGDYCDNWLMYSEWLRRIDLSIYKAILNRTANSGSFAEFCFERGILTKQHILTPPPDYERQVMAIRIALARNPHTG